MRSLNRAGVARSTAMALVGYRTESIYRRYSIDDGATLKEAVAKLTLLHETEATDVSTSVVAQIRKS